MSSEWREITFGDFVAIQRGHDLPDQDRKQGNVPILGSFGITGYHDIARAKGPGVTIGRSGASFGVAAYSDEDFWPLNTALFVTDFKGNHPKYVFYFMKAFDFSGFNSGSAQPSLNRNNLYPVLVQVPEPIEQKQIADTLAALDDRITLLRETNATLEAIAQTLFKSWFVDFDPVRAKQQGQMPEGMDEATAALFPDSFEESKFGIVPSGWAGGTIEDCCSKVESGGTPKRTVPEYWHADIPWLTSGEVRNPIVFETKEKISALGVKESSAKVWPSGTTVVAMYGATAGEVCLLASPMTANQACCGLIPRDNFRSFLFFSVRRERQNLAAKSTGSAQQNLNKGLVSQHPILIPNESVVAAYENIVDSLLNRWIANEQLAQTVAAIRDTLLPRLISGQLRIAEAEDAVEEVTA